MIEFEEVKLKLKSLKTELDDLKNTLDIESIQKKINELESLTYSENFWNNPAETKSVLSELTSLKNTVQSFKNLCSNHEDIAVLIEISDLEEDLSLLPEIKTKVNNLSKNIETLTLSTLLTGEYDYGNAILTLHAGAGGTEAQDWAEMLYRMYSRWCENNGYKIKLLDSIDGDGAGLKSASVLIEGTNAYGFLKGESGVHRLVRISPFDSSGRRHTSFASIEVIPEIDDNIVVEISPDDIKMDVFRASGAGGQHVNKTSSAVRLTHIPTGIAVACQNGRSQYQNRDTALKILKSKLVEIKEREHLEKIEDIKGVQKEIAWGSQIRSYVFMPYTLVKDHRTGFEVGNVASVMDGNIGGFINAYLNYSKNF